MSTVFSVKDGVGHINRLAPNQSAEMPADILDGPNLSPYQVYRLQRLEHLKGTGSWFTAKGNGPELVYRYRQEISRTENNVVAMYVYYYKFPIFDIKRSIKTLINLLSGIKIEWRTK